MIEISRLSFGFRREAETQVPADARVTPAREKNHDTDQHRMMRVSVCFHREAAMSLRVFSDFKDISGDAFVASAEVGSRTPALPHSGG